MAKKIEVIIGADNKSLKDTLNDSRGALKSFSSFTTGLIAGFGISIFQSASSAISDFISGAEQEAKEAQRVITSLRQTLETAGRTDLFDSILEKSDELQKKFKTLDNDDITGVFQRLITFGGLTENQINKLVPLIIDLNAKQKLAGDVNRSLADSADQVIKGIQGQGRELKLYGVEVDASKSSTENLGIILEQLGPKVKGAGEAFANSLEGQLAATTQRAKDLQEELGNKLLPFKVTLINFALEAADAFQTLSEKILGTHDSAQKTRNELKSLDESKKKAKEFAENAAEFLRTAPEDVFQTFVTNLEKDVDVAATTLAKKLEEFPGTNVEDFPSNKKMLQAKRDIVDAVREQRRLETDKTVIGRRTEETKEDEKKVDLLKERIAVLKEIVSLERKGLKSDDIQVTDASLELKNLEIKLINRDTKDKDLAAQLIRLRFPEFDGKNLNLSMPDLQLGIPIKLESVSDTISKIDAAGDDLAQGISRMYNRLTEQGEKDGAKAREAQARTLEQLTDSINSTISDTVGSIGEGIGDILAGGDPVSAFINVIANALQSLGRALVAFGIAKKFAIESLKKVDPFIAIAAGVAAIATGALLRKQLSNPVRLAEGGFATRPTIAMVGESGPEVIAPLNKFRDLISVGSGLIPELVETKERGGDIYRVWKFHHARNNRLNP